MENLYDTIRSLEREKSNQEHVLQDLKEDMRSMREKMEVSTSGRSLAHQGDHPAALAAAAAAGNNSRQLELFRNEFMDQFAKMQHQINGYVDKMEDDALFKCPYCHIVLGPPPPPPIYQNHSDILDQEFASSLSTFFF